MRLTKFHAAVIAGLLFSGPALAMSFGSDEPTPDLKTAQSHADSGNYDDAIKTLQAILENDSNNADAWNLLGYSYRKNDNLDHAWDAYERALTIEPNHLGANEYIGELYLRQGNVEQAQAQLEKLKILCPDGCTELDTLQNAINKAGS